jgi:hypothetical protein
MFRYELILYVLVEVAAIFGENRCLLAVTGVNATEFTGFAGLP